MRGENGFTLMELLVVIGLLAVVAIAVWPGFGGRNTSELSVTQSQIVAVLRNARARAIGQNREVTVTIDARKQLLDGRELPKQVALRVLSEGSRQAEEVSRFRFFADGTSTGGEISLRVGDEAKKIVVNWLTGNVDAVSEK